MDMEKWFIFCFVFYRETNQTYPITKSLFIYLFILYLLLLLWNIRQMCNYVNIDKIWNFILFCPFFYCQTNQVNTLRQKIYWFILYLYPLSWNISSKFTVAWTRSKNYLFLLPIFPSSSHSMLCFLFCRPFVVNAIFSTGLVGCWSFFCLLTWVVESWSSNHWLF